MNYTDWFLSSNLLTAEKIQISFEKFDKRLDILTTSGKYNNGIGYSIEITNHISNGLPLKLKKSKLIKILALLLISY
jgi:hypothetical protein